MLIHRIALCGQWCSRIVTVLDSLKRHADSVQLPVVDDAVYCILHICHACTLWHFITHASSCAFIEKENHFYKPNFMLTVDVISHSQNSANNIPFKKSHIKAWDKDVKSSARPSRSNQLLHPEDGGSMLLRNVGVYLQNHMLKIPEGPQQ